IGINSMFGYRVFINISYASACESARILLNSKNKKHPKGLANSSGQVGRNLMDSTGAWLGAQIPALKGRPRYNEDGHTANHLFIPWWGHQAQANNELDFPRGYHFEIGGGFRQPGSGVSGDKQGYGPALKQQIRDAYGSYAGFALRGEMLPNKDTYMEIDENVKDKWGIPVSKFHFKWSDRELKQIEHGLKTAKQILEHMGAFYSLNLPCSSTLTDLTMASVITFKLPVAFAIGNSDVVV
ncbi:MAG: hypothetical protein AAGK05_17855, partial [Pseudomonadota bacterium]